MSGNVFYFDWEINLIAWLQENLGGIAVGSSKALSTLGSEVVLTLTILYFYLCVNKKLGRRIFINTITALTFGTRIKNVFKRLRPYMVSEEVECLVPVDTSGDVNDPLIQGYSFPSLHSLNMAVITSSIHSFFKDKISLIIMLVLSFGIAFSRIVTANHFPSDVLTGLAIGFITTFLVNKVTRKYALKHIYLAILIINATGFLYCDSNDFFSAYGLMLGFFIADLYQEKYVNFKNTNNTLRGIIRIIFAGLIFLGISGGLKAGFNYLNVTNTVIINVYRTFRYCLSTFVVIALYPRIFVKNLFKFNEK